MVTDEQKLENWQDDKGHAPPDERIQFYASFMDDGNFEKFIEFVGMDQSLFYYRRNKWQALWNATRFVPYQEELYNKLSNEMAFIPFTQEELESDWWKQFESTTT